MKIRVKYMASYSGIIDTVTKQVDETYSKGDINALTDRVHDIAEIPIIVDIDVDSGTREVVDEKDLNDEDKEDEMYP
jgi:hypothetical protein